MLWPVNTIGPTTGMLERTGIVSAGRRSAPLFVRPSPRTRARPVPRKVRARPDTTWSARRWIVTRPWRRASSAPVAIATMSPSHGLPVDSVVEIDDTGTLGEDLADRREQQDGPGRDAGGDDEPEIHQPVPVEGGAAAAL